MAGATDDAAELQRLQKDLASSDHPSFATLRDYLRQASTPASPLTQPSSCLSARGGAPSCPRRAPAPPARWRRRRRRRPCLSLTGAAPTLPAPVQVRLLRLRDTERVVKHGSELLQRHARKLDAVERERARRPPAAACRLLLVLLPFPLQLGTHAHDSCCQDRPSQAMRRDRACCILPTSPHPRTTSPARCLACSVGGARAGGGGSHGRRPEGAGAQPGLQRAQALPRRRPRQPPHGEQWSRTSSRCSSSR
jgi:hypothetical protein